MKRTFQIFGVLIAGSLGILAVLVILIIVVFSSFTENLCANTILYEVNSPDNKYKAVIFERDAGATTGFSTQVSILPSKSTLPNKPGNLFIADTDHGKAPSGKGGGPEVRVNWLGSNEVVLEYHKNARVFRHEKSINGIKVVYTQFD